MRKFNEVIAGLSRRLDLLAGVMVVGTMLLIVGNIILRGVLKMPIPGTYEIVGFLTSLSIAFALAFCGLQGAHISADIFMQKAPLKFRRITEALTNLVFTAFWGATAWQMWRYAADLKQTGVVSSTSQIPVYPVVFLIGIGFLALCLVSVTKLLISVSGILSPRTAARTERFFPAAELMTEAGESR